MTSDYHDDFELIAYWEEQIARELDRKLEEYIELGLRLYAEIEAGERQRRWEWENSDAGAHEARLHQEHLETLAEEAWLSF